ncbi:4-hydroxyphenylacetate 3-monooxygenase reductase component [Vespertiliibacter pulmonis]|uniref:4-hydroxyphenylacetate 3-monooxygenase reductase component n=2 Tax=Vespertiliibacter pulmonis TaxID=1443036 RepID=A0A3N4VDT2_9PAST|nr:4-hydroxyphenylacetate 3-monooxygenase, reductase component [Vespertiliibacter pulmonis]RPE80788.1 4-hydroxyphenylacetate 3-monooxygenase reductase component [Vespertiliibacter pulmonis]
MADFSQQFRDAMAHLSASVHIVTSNGEAGKIGITVSSVTSVSDSPPTLLFCVNQQSELHDILKRNGEVCVNVLNHEQADLAKHFAGMENSTMEERFSWDIWSENEKGIPKLDTAIANLEGKIVEMYAVGSHTIFIVALSAIQSTPNHSLVYFARQFKTVKI